jgi:hypothetical protein
MAIRKDHVHNTILYTNAYIRIDTFDSGTKAQFNSDRAAMHCWAGIYADKPGAGEQPICVTNVKFEYDLMSQDNLWKQAYLAMKAMPEWQDAIDDV